MGAGWSFHSGVGCGRCKAIAPYSAWKVVLRTHNAEISIAHTAEKSAEFEFGSDQDNKTAGRGIAHRVARFLGLYDDLALHLFVSGATSLAAGKGVCPGLGGFDIYRHGFAFRQFKTIFAEDEGEARRRVDFRAIGERADVQAMGAVGGNDLQANLFADFHVDHHWVKFEILRGHRDDARRSLDCAFRLRFRVLVVLQ